jgi:hypothetical protein
LTVSSCVLVFTSCNSSRHIAGKYFQNNRSYSKSLRKPYETKNHKKRKHSPAKCNPKKIEYVNRDNKRIKNSEIYIKHKTDFTFIILEEQNQFSQDEEMMFVPKNKSITPPEVVAYNQYERIMKIKKGVKYNSWRKKHGNPKFIF